MRADIEVQWQDGLTGHGPDPAVMPRSTVVALHCSGADGRQWRKLKEALPPWFNLVAIDCYGCESMGAWTGEHAFALTDEARRVVELMDDLSEPVHLVGHSYGGGVALRAATERPSAIASIALYEPSAFHMLAEIGPAGMAAQAEIRELAKAVCRGVISGDYQGALTAFVDYWNGEGATAALPPQARASLLRWLPKAPLDFRALLDERTPLRTYHALAAPALILRGANGPGPSRLIAETLASVMPVARLAVIAGAGHMGPFTHGADVNAAIVGHLSAWAMARAPGVMPPATADDVVAA